tara:strand:+ start:226 stop:1554 length:1329 start_codon:yes stop_codon:yes gene_type:complete
VAVAKSGQLAKELELAEKEQMLAAEGRRAGVAEAEARGALERQAGLMDALAEVQAELRRKEAVLHAAAERERTEVEVTQQGQLRKLAAAEEAAKVSAAEAAGGEARHALAVESVKALRHLLGEREAALLGALERVRTVEGVELPAAEAAATAAAEKEAAATMALQGCELRLRAQRTQFDDTLLEVAKLTRQLASMGEQVASAQAAQSLAEGLAQASGHEAMQATLQRGGERARVEALTKEEAELRVSLRRSKQRAGELSAQLDAAGEAREAAAEAAEVKAQKAQAADFEAGLARDALDDERSKRQLAQATYIYICIHIWTWAVVCIGDPPPATHAGCAPLGPSRAAHPYPCRIPMPHTHAAYHPCTCTCRAPMHTHAHTHAYPCTCLAGRAACEPSPRGGDAAAAWHCAYRHLLEASRRLRGAAPSPLPSTLSPNPNPDPEP